MLGYIFTGLICAAAAVAVWLLLFRRKNCCGSCRGDCSTCRHRAEKQNKTNR